MGYQLERIEITASLSAHNSERDREHRALFREMAERVRRVVDDARYEDILAMIDTGIDWDQDPNA